MARFKVFLEYEGTRYSGWQVQKNARTVQGEILNACHNVFGSPEVEFYGSGRTDAGVHALQQVAHLQAETVLAPEIIRVKINDELPSDINLLEVMKASGKFHARHDAVARSYLYQISRRRTALGKRFVWWIRDALELSSMKSAAKIFVGMKDFRSFTAEEEKSTAALIEGIELAEAGDLILVRLVGSHFLWKMARQIVGILVEIGRGAISPEEVRRMFSEESGEPSKHTAPPSGLFLERVYYAGEARLGALDPVLNVGPSRPKR